jgi:hypothetical protein
MNINRKQRWVSRTLKFIQEGEVKLGSSDVFLIRDSIDRFFYDYIEANYEEPIFDRGNIRILYYGYLSNFYSIPRIERWAKEDNEALESLN